MKNWFMVISSSLVLAIFIGACSSIPDTPDVMEEMDDMEEMVATPMMDDETEAAADEMMDGDADSGEEMEMSAPDWFSAVLTNVQNGENFTIADHSGKVVLVETLAMWCSKCLQQQGNVRELHQLLGTRDDFISIGIDIDPNENADALKTYINQNGFDWVYTISSPEVAREIGQLYGSQFLNPPSTPMLIIDRHGNVHTLPFGIKSAQELLAYLEPFLNESM